MNSAQSNSVHLSQRFVEALAYASEKHRFQVRKGRERTPFIHHPIQVTQLLSNYVAAADDNLLCAALLHDTLEDTDATAAELERRFGSQVCRIVQEVTDAKRLQRTEREQCQIDEAPTLSEAAKLVRLADKVMNVHDVGRFPPLSWSVRRRLEYIDWCEAVVYCLRGVNAELEARFAEECHCSRRRIAEEAADLNPT